MNTNANRRAGLTARLGPAAGGASVLLALIMSISWAIAVTVTSDVMEEARQQALGRAVEAESRLAAVEHELARARSILAWSEAYGIPADLASAIHSAAITEGLQPEIGFRLVQHESGFRQRAVSPLGAIGYTQLLPSTAMWLEPGLTEARLYDRDTNLRLGFRYLKQLMDRYDSDPRLALLAYNRGPAVVSARLARGEDPGNGFARRVLGAAE